LTTGGGEDEGGAVGVRGAWGESRIWGAGRKKMGDRGGKCG